MADWMSPTPPARFSTIASTGLRECYGVQVIYTFVRTRNAVLRRAVHTWIGYDTVTELDLIYRLTVHTLHSSLRPSLTPDKSWRVRKPAVFTSQTHLPRGTDPTSYRCPVFPSVTLHGCCQIFTSRGHIFKSSILLVVATQDDCIFACDVDTNMVICE